MDDKKTMGIIGTGNMGLLHARAASHFDIDIVAGCARSTNDSFKKFKETFKNAKFVGSPKSILDNKDIHYVVVALPIGETNKIMDQILQCKKPVLIEQPAYLSAPGPGVAVSRNKCAALSYRYYSTVERLKDKIENSDVANVQVSISEPLVGRPHGAIDKILYYSSLHILDVILYVFNDITLKDVYRAGNSISLSMVYKDRPVFITINGDSAGTTTMVVNMTDGESCVLSPMDMMAFCDKLTIQDKDGQKMYVSSVSEVVQESAVLKPGIVPQMKAFLKMQGTPLTEAFKVLNLIDSINSKMTYNF